MKTDELEPQNSEIPGKIWTLATTLTDEAQEAALRKSKGLGFDLSRGTVPLEETLLNLSSARDILVEAVQQQKLIQLPLKLQRSLLESVEKVSEDLVELAAGSDRGLSLNANVDNLASMIWQYRLENMSDQILGYQKKLNQIKVMEARLREAVRQADDFRSASEDAESQSKRLAELLEQAESQRGEFNNVRAAADEVVAKMQQDEARAAGAGIQVEQHSTLAAQQLASAVASAAEAKEEAAAAKTAKGEARTVRTSLTNLLAKYENDLASLEKQGRGKLEAFQEDSAVVLTEVKAEAATATKQAETAIAASESRFETQVNVLKAEASAKIDQLSTSAQESLESETGKVSALVDATEAANGAVQAKFAEAEKARIQVAEAERVRLVAELEELEGRIREAIERATGYTLFHSFQTRQLQIAKSKNFWALALGSLVLVSFSLSLFFIWSLQFVKVYDAAFFLKLSVSVPIIYAIAFCNVQYSRERRLEEEYAFKSNISISLDPYRRLVAEVVDKEKPEELEKYTAFLIDSVNRVFTSPTGSIFAMPEDETHAERLMKAFAEAVEPIVKAAKK